VQVHLGIDVGLVEVRAAQALERRTRRLAAGLDRRARRGCRRASR
jgi:hypothetical protein